MANEQICIFLGKSIIFLAHLYTTKCTKSHIFHCIITVKAQYQNSVILTKSSLKELFFNMVSVITVLVYRALSVFLRSFLSTNNYLASITPRLCIAGFITRIVFLFLLGVSSISVKEVCLEIFFL